MKRYFFIVILNMSEKNKSIENFPFCRAYEMKNGVFYGVPTILVGFTFHTMPWHI